MNAIEHITQTAAQCKEIDGYIEAQVLIATPRLIEFEDNIYSFVVEEFQKENIVIQKGLVRKILKNLGGNLKDLEAKHVDLVLSLIEKPVGKYVYLPYHILAKREYTKIKLYLQGDDENFEKVNNSGVQEPLQLPISIQIPGECSLPMYQSILNTQIIIYEKNIIIPKNSCTKWFDYDKIENTVEIRTRKTGDYIQIDRAGSRKKLKDYFIDRKIPKENRDNMLLIADGNHIMWVLGDMIGERMSEKYKVEETTKRVLLMKLIKMEEQDNV